MTNDELTEKIIGCAMRVHSILGPGFLESVYENAFAHELRKHGMNVVCQCPVQVIYDGIIVGDFITDMCIDNKVIIENKAILSLNLAHEVQLVNYLSATGIDIGLLFNFGSPSLQHKRKHRVYRK